MKKHWIYFGWDDVEEIGRKVALVEELIGEDNVVRHMCDVRIPYITIRCTKKQWREIKFKLELAHMWM